MLGYLHVVENACEKRGCAYLYILSLELQNAFAIACLY
jgi:hypothetical protein